MTQIAHFATFTIRFPCSLIRKIICRKANYDTITIENDDSSLATVPPPSYYNRLFDSKKNARARQIILLMVKTGKDKSWILDELVARKATAGLPIARQRNLLEILLTCSDHVLTRIAAILKGIEYDYSLEHAGQERHSPGNSSKLAANPYDSSLGIDLAESLCFVVCLSVRGRSNLRHVLKGDEVIVFQKLINYPGGAYPSINFRAADDAFFEASLRASLDIGFNPG